LVDIDSDLAVEMDEMWSFYHDKKHQVWLWWAVDHETNVPLAYCFGTREHKYLDELLKLLKPFNIGTVYSDNNYAYHDKIEAENLVTGKRNTQQIERHHLTLRTRIKRLCRKTICFSKSRDIHMAVVGTFINIHFFGRILVISTYL
jgi:insertion element IS1 protein InsB